MADLFRTFEIPDEIEDVEPIVTYGNAPRFDFAAGDFAMTGGRLEMLDGYEAWVQWCLKTAITDRYRYLLYSDDYGTEMDDVRRARTPDEAEDLLQETVTAALLEDPRTASVSEFEFEWAGDELRAQFTIEPTIGTTRRVEIERIR